jgi:hypothetical protein
MAICHKFQFYSYPERNTSSTFKKKIKISVMYSIQDNYKTASARPSPIRAPPPSPSFVLWWGKNPSLFEWQLAGTCKIIRMRTTYLRTLKISTPFSTAID